ncbi:hypothetical protein UM93_04180 [Psychromicrobium lacuslunae]|uniref:Uncharacterized protein n=1 Tax=Psychromicrobium lacuslunae TaxID=1618207 RepID=A0A0D4BXQ0_9MICC|nr:hypothetical protein UM93_04180 [Psychromicrobium lacuslunae]
MFKRSEIDLIRRCVFELRERLPDLEILVRIGFSVKSIDSAIVALDQHGEFSQKDPVELARWNLKVYLNSINEIANLIWEDSYVEKLQTTRKELNDLWDKIDGILKAG